MQTPIEGMLGVTPRTIHLNAYVIRLLAVIHAHEPCGLDRIPE